MKKTFVLTLSILTVLASCKSSKHADLGDGLFADIKTNKGDIIVKLESELTPVTVANFVSLAEGDNPFVSDEYKGKKYYDGLTFHRVMKDFMIQGGDPLANGTGNPGYKFGNEIVDSLKHNRAGLLSMANGGPGTNGSQFFITHAPTPWLDGKHTVFGEVVNGMDIVDSIANVKVAAGSNKPLEDVVMDKVEIIRNGRAAKKFDAPQIMKDYFAEQEEIAKAKAKIKSDFVTEAMAQKEKAETLPSGLKILSITEGDGDKPKMGTYALVNYAGWTEEGTLIDSNLEECAKKFDKYDQRRKEGNGYTPFPMKYSTDSNLIAGFREALLTMKVGDKVRVFIPSHLGYGAQGSGPVPPNADLIFDLEITGIKE